MISHKVRKADIIRIIRITKNKLKKTLSRAVGHQMAFNNITEIQSTENAIFMP